MKNFILFISILLSTNNIINAQTSIEEDNKKAVIIFLNLALKNCIFINNLESPEEMVKNEAYATSHQFFYNEPITYNAACFQKAKMTYYQAKQANGYLFQAIIFAAKNRDDELIKELKYKKHIIDKIIDCAIDAKYAAFYNAIELGDYKHNMNAALNNSLKATEQIKILLNTLQ